MTLPCAPRDPVVPSVQSLQVPPATYSPVSLVPVQTTGAALASVISALPGAKLAKDSVCRVGASSWSIFGNTGVRAVSVRTQGPALGGVVPPTQAPFLPVAPCTRQ